ncbi:hypothetical protein [Arcobacter porcinus]|uniref:Uncharacterized protein n=1 Tax=Arcobacter porcinus TaxID=1935204 RepID=A0A5C2HHV5_9BACT|nr:hypothetical protein [Arcobacter porcinus]OCL90716.1 hypothetical protein AAX27_01527 [Aliarcobacter thereius]QEP40871.1 hypothetical protein APORC_1276 [Arcobacter porcinus]
MVRFNGKTIVDIKNNEYKMKIKKYLCKLMPPIHFSIGNVAQLFINGKYIFLWQDAKGQVCYCFDIYDREYFTTSAIKLGNVLSQHFQCEIEVVNNEKEHLKKMVSAQAQLNKGIGDLERHNLYNGGMNFTNDSLPYLSNGYLNSVPVIQQNNYQHPLQNQESLYNGIIQLSTYYLESHLRTLYIKIDELPIVYKTLFRPNINMAFFYEKNMNCKNSYVPSKYQIQNLSEYDFENSFIMTFILFLAKDNIDNVMMIFKWLVYVVNSKNKLPYPLVFHSTDDSCIKLFWEEIVEPLLNPSYCEKFSNDTVDEKLLINKLDEKVIYNFHNITTSNILNLSSNDFMYKLINKDELKIGNKIVTTLANVFISSTTKYIPLISRDISCIFIEVESNLDNLKLNYNQAVELINKDLSNFSTILKYIDFNNLEKENPCSFYNYENMDMLDASKDVLDAFENIIKNKDIVPFDNLKNQNKKLYNKLVEDFEKNRVDRKNLFEYFSALFGESIYRNNNQLIKDLKDLSDAKEPFGNIATFNNNGRVYYRL